MGAFFLCLKAGRGALLPWDSYGIIREIFRSH